MEKPTTQTPKKIENSKHKTNKYPYGKSRKEFQKVSIQNINNSED